MDDKLKNVYLQQKIEKKHEQRQRQIHSQCEPSIITSGNDSNM